MQCSLNRCAGIIAFFLMISIHAQAATTATTGKVMYIDFDLKDSLPVASVDMNGKHQEFMVDTGSSTALHLSKDFMKDLSGLIIDEGKERSTDLTGRVILNDKFHFSRLSINGMVFKSVEGVSLTPWGITLKDGDSLPTSMVIGLGLFKEKAVLIDYKHRRLSVADNSQELAVNSADDWITLPLLITREGIVIKVTQGANSYNMILDTGATMSFFWRERLKSAFDAVSCSSVMREMSDEGCVASEFQFEDAGEKIVKLSAVLMDGVFRHVEMDGLVGNNFFEKYDVLVDFPKRRMLIRSNELLK